MDSDAVENSGNGEELAVAGPGEAAEEPTIADPAEQEASAEAPAAAEEAVPEAAVEAGESVEPAREEASGAAQPQAAEPRRARRIESPPGMLLRLVPRGPWRLGPDSGARDRVARLCHSDTLFSALTRAALDLGWLEEWLEATVRTETPLFRTSSLFPAAEDSLLVPAPPQLWPPPGVTRLRASGARWIPGTLVGALLSGAGFNEEQWEVDGSSECLLRRGRRIARTGLYRVALRSRAAVDRTDQGNTVIHKTACVEYADGAGLWAVVQFASDEARREWAPRVEACFRLLGDTGLGGGRSQGWGHFDIEETRRGPVRDLVLGHRPHQMEADSAEPVESVHWLLSLFVPSPGDEIDWSRGNYSLVDRSGRVESGSGWGAVKKNLRMVREGSVLASSAAPRGTAVDVAPDGFPHPVYRSGMAVSLELPWRGNA